MTISDCLNLVHADLSNIEYYTAEIKSGIEDNELSMEDVLHQLLPLKEYVDSLCRGVDGHIRNPYLLGDDDDK